MAARKVEFEPGPSSRLDGRSVIAGLGQTGVSCARYLHARGLEFVATDSRAMPPGLATLRQLAPMASIRVGGFDAGLLDGAARVIASPGISLHEPLLTAAVARGIPVIGDIEVFAHAAEAPVVAITGTNGKSTVTTLVALMVEAAGRRALAGGNLGRPALELLADPVPDFYVLELSSFQLETTHSLRTAAAAVLNVTPDHLDRYASVAEYAVAKARIFSCANVAVINQDDALVRTMPRAGQRVIGFSLENTADYGISNRDDETFLMRRGQPLVALSELKVPGLHNAANVLAACAVIEALGLAVEPGIAAVKAFTGLPHRSQWVADIAGVRYIDDSKGTNVGATLAAVAGMPGSLVVVAGGQGKGQDFAPLGSAFRNKVRHAVLLGQDATLLAAALRGVCTTEFAVDMDAAVLQAARAARRGETVLLSPACASLDMFRDYAHRGDVFAAAVRRLKP